MPTSKKLVWLAAENPPPLGNLKVGDVITAKLAGSSQPKTFPYAVKALITEISTDHIIAIIENVIDWQSSNVFGANSLLEELKGKLESIPKTSIQKIHNKY